MPDIGVNIARIRAAHGLSREAFASALGVTLDKVKNVENNKQRVDHEFLNGLRELYNVDLNDLLAGSTPGGSGQILPSGQLAPPDFVLIPRYAVEASAGPGAAADCEEATGFYAFNKKWLERRGLNPADLAVIGVRGDSGEPYLSDGDSILVNMAETQPLDGLTYAIRLGNDLVVKSVQRIGASRIALLSANPLYPPREIDLGELDGDAAIIGRLVTSMHQW